MAPARRNKLNQIIDDLYGLYKNSTSPNAEEGFARSTMYEPNNIRHLNTTDADETIEGQNNQAIWFRRDGFNDHTDGLGGAGHAKCGAIDICVGFSSILDQEDIPGPVNPSTGGDAARVYISQKSLVDEYFGIKLPTFGKSSPRSTVAIKADDVRLIARNSFKIVTNTDYQLSINAPSMNGTGVQLIANNESPDTLQPMVKGQNLIEGLTELTLKIDAINSTLLSFMQAQKSLNEELRTHVHQVPFYDDAKTFYSTSVFQLGLNVNTFIDTLQEKNKMDSINLGQWRNKFLDHGDKHIASAYHLLN